jgi:uncharacterized protein (TIGR03382 family)
MRNRLSVLVVLTVLLVPGLARATNLNSSIGELFDFMDGLGGAWSADGSMSDGGGDAYDGCYYLDVNGMRYNAPMGAAVLTMGGRQIEMPSVPMGTLSVRRIMYVPSTGASYARYLEVIENSGTTDTIATVTVSGNLGSDSSTILRSTSSGDAALTVADTWFNTDDGALWDPPLAHVFQGSSGAVRATSVSLSGDNINYSYSVPIPAGGRAVIMHFAIQQTTSDAAQTDARYVVETPDDTLVGADEWVDDIVNFGVAVAGAPRVTFDGPFSVREGEAVALDITVMDPEGMTPTWTWDLDGDGTFGEMPGVTSVMVTDGATDGPGMLRVGVEATDGTNTAQRYRVITVENVAPVISSMLATNLVSVGQRWTYPLVVVDPAGAADPLTYTVTRGPEDMTISPTGVVTWTPDSGDVTMGDERVDVTITVDDGDGGTAEQNLALQVTPNRAPPGLTLLYPSAIAVLDTTPRLAVTSAIDEDFDPLTYFFQIDDTEDFSSPLVEAGPIPEGAGFTALELTEPLAPGQYHWRAWAFDGAAEGERRSTYFVVAGDPITVDAGEAPDAGGVRPDAGGGTTRGGCSAAPGRSAAPWLAVLGLALLFLRRRA